MSSHIAVIHFPFASIQGIDPSEEADEILRDLQRHGFEDAVLEEVFEEGAVLPEREKPQYLFKTFSRTELECGHGEDFRCVFTIRRHDGSKYVIESVDVQMAGCYESDPYVGIGGVGGELTLDCPLNKDGSHNIEQMCRDWVGKWHRSFVGKTEDSVLGMFYIIKQIIAEGNFSNN
jgi:hypothetical protein